MGKIIEYNIIKKTLDGGGLINRGDEIPFEVFELIRNFNKTKVRALFTTYPKGDKNYYSVVKYKVHFKCDKCNTNMFDEVSKSRLLSNKEIICDDCQNQINKDIVTSDRLNKLLFDIKKMKNVEEYLTFLNPINKWDKNYSNRDRWDLINNDYYIDEALISETLKNLPYKEFLKTPYWKAVAQRVMYIANYSCQLCSKNKVILNIHHKTYEHHGLEHNYLEDLICLCYECHEQFHEKLKN